MIERFCENYELKEISITLSKRSSSHKDIESFFQNIVDQANSCGLKTLQILL